MPVEGPAPPMAETMAEESGNHQFLTIINCARRLLDLVTNVMGRGEVENRRQVAALGRGVVVTTSPARDNAGKPVVTATGTSSMA